MDFDAWIHHWRRSLEAQFDLVPGPQLVEGLVELVIAGGPTDPPTGRAATVNSGTWNERWVVTHPANAREANTATIQAIPPLDPDPTIDWMTSSLLYQGLSTPLRRARDAFAYISPVPQPPPDHIPSPDVVRRYKVFNVPTSGSPVQRGALYRQILNNGTQDTRWMDHWVLTSAYTPPAIGGVKVRLVRDDPAGTLAAFLSGHPSSSKYALLDLKWSVP